MSSPVERVWAHAGLADADLDWLALLQADWQIIADLSFADLVLWIADRDGGGYWAASQMRPTTGPTALLDDVVGAFVERGVRPLLDTAFDGRIAREGDPEWREDVPVRVEAFPVRRGERVIAVVARNTNLRGVRTPSQLELAYLQTAGELTQMIARGGFPFPGQRSDHADSPRVGDGFIRVDSFGRVDYASPNAHSLFRRLGLTGDLAGQDLAATTRSLVPPRRRLDEETLSSVLSARMPRDTEIDTGVVTVILRAIPLRPEGVHTGGLILLRDVTDLRRRDRELVTKDATIREIHHRVKNNLQTVAALLRLQARRIDSESGRDGLEEAVRRVGAIAVVHDTLSQTFEESVDFDAIADQLIGLVGEVVAREEPVTIRREGSFATIGSEIATPLAMMLTELLQNALEHGFPQGGPGQVRVTVRHSAEELVVEVVDDGIGVRPDLDVGDSASLGLSIVRTLAGELGGRFELRPGEQGGTHAEIVVPLAPG